MTQNQTDRFNAALRGHSVVTIAQIGNLIDACLEGRVATANVKTCRAWSRLTDDQKVEVSRLLDKWLYEADGGQGCLSPQTAKAYYESNCRTSAIMAAKLIL